MLRDMHQQMVGGRTNHKQNILHGSGVLFYHFPSWRGGGDAALLRFWIRRARPMACAWRTESHTLTSFPYLLPYDILS